MHAVDLCMLMSAVAACRAAYMDSHDAFVSRLHAYHRNVYIEVFEMVMQW